MGLGNHVIGGTVVIFTVENKILEEIIRKLEKASTREQLLIRECVRRLNIKIENAKS